MEYGTSVHQKLLQTNHPPTVRIAYIAPYQGKSLRQRRPILLNLSLAGTAKIEGVAILLQQSGSDVEIFSQGEVIERNWTFYPGFDEANRFHPDIPVSYSSALPIPFLNGLWQSWNLLALFKARHRIDPFDLVIIYNLKMPQVMAAHFAIKQLDLPVIVEYEDLAVAGIDGLPERTFSLNIGYNSRMRKILREAAGCMACSPFLLEQFPKNIPKLLIRGVVGADAMRVSLQKPVIKQNWILFSGTHYRTKGIASLIIAWSQMDLPDWELHITGDGEETKALRQLAEPFRNIYFHGVVGTAELAMMMATAKICINPHDLSVTPGNVFAFKIIEYLAAGTHVVTTPMGYLEKEIEIGITYIPNNDPETISKALLELVRTERWKVTASEQVRNIYGPDALKASLNDLILRAKSGGNRELRSE